MFSILFYLLSSDILPINSMVNFRVDVRGMLRRMYNLWIWGGDFRRYLLGLLGPDLSSSPGCPC